MRVLVSPKYQNAAVAANKVDMMGYLFVDVGTREDKWPKSMTIWFDSRFNLNISADCAGFTFLIFLKMEIVEASKKKYSLKEALGASKCSIMKQKPQLWLIRYWSSHPSGEPSVLILN